MTANNLDTAWALLVHGVVGALEYREDLENLGAACPLLARICNGTCNTKSLWTKLNKEGAGKCCTAYTLPKPSMHITPSMFYRSTFYTISVFNPRTFLMPADYKYTHFSVYENYIAYDGVHRGHKRERQVEYDGPRNTQCSIYVCHKYVDGALLDLNRFRVVNGHNVRCASLCFKSLPVSFSTQAKNHHEAYVVHGRIEDSSVVFSDSDFIVHSDAVTNTKVFFAADGVFDDVYIKVRLGVPHLEQNDIIYTTNLGGVVGCYRSTDGIMPSRHMENDITYFAARCPSKMLDGIVGRDCTLEEINSFLASDGVEFVLPRQIYCIA